MEYICDKCVTDNVWNVGSECVIDNVECVINVLQICGMRAVNVCGKCVTNL